MVILLLLFISLKSIHLPLTHYFLICSFSTYRNIPHTKLETHLLTHSANYPSRRTLLSVLFYYTEKTDAMRKEITHIPSQQIEQHTCIRAHAVRLSSCSVQNSMFLDHPFSLSLFFAFLLQYVCICICIMSVCVCMHAQVCIFPHLS